MALQAANCWLAMFISAYSLKAHLCKLSHIISKKTYPLPQKCNTAWVFGITFDMLQKKNLSLCCGFFFSHGERPLCPCKVATYLPPTAVLELYKCIHSTISSTSCNDTRGDIRTPRCRTVYRGCCTVHTTAQYYSLYVRHGWSHQPTMPYVTLGALQPLTLQAIVIKINSILVKASCLISRNTTTFNTSRIHE